MKQDQHGGAPQDHPQNPDRTNPEKRETQEERFERSREGADIDSTTQPEVSMHDDERTAANVSDEESIAAPDHSSEETQSEVSTHDDDRIAANKSDDELAGNPPQGGLDRDEQRRAAGKGGI